MDYWVVGATWNEGEKDLATTFYRRGYWEMDYTDIQKPDYASKRDSIKAGDRIAIKRCNGRAATTICIKAIGIVKEVDNGRVYVDWIRKGLDRPVPSKNYFGTIHGPISSEDEWVWKAFCL